jgi:cell division protease FtsH
MALGFTWNLPRDDRRLETKARFMDQIATFLGGRVAEEEFFGKDNITTGAQNDLKKATQLARKMVTEYGMSDKLGTQIFGHKEEMPFLGKEYTEHRNYSEEVANMIDKEVSTIINNAKTEATEIIKKHKDNIQKIADILLEKETIEADEFEQYLPTRKVAKK